MEISYRFFFNDTATTEIYTLSLHDALPISTAQGDSEVASSTVLLSMSQTALLLFLVAFVVVSLNKLSALEEELTQLKITLEEELTHLQSSSKSGIC